MAHAIDNTKGFNAFAQFSKDGKKAWHGLGHIFTEQPTDANQILEHAGLDYTVQKSPLIYGTMPNIRHLKAAHKKGDMDKLKELIDSINLIEAENSFYTWRQDIDFCKDSILGSGMTQQYKVLQNAQVINVMDGMIQSGEVTFETAGALFGGAVIFVCCKLKQQMEVTKKDVSDVYIVFTHGHNGKNSVKAFFTSVRVVCNNTLQMALKGMKDSVTFKHTTNAEDNLSKANKMLHVAKENRIAFEAKAQEMRKTQINLSDYILNVFNDPKDLKRALTSESVLDTMSMLIGSDKKNGKKDIITKVVNQTLNGIGQDGTKTAWNAYNGVTHYLSRKEYSGTSDSRFKSIMQDGSYKTNTRALNLAANPSLIVPVNKINIITEFGAQNFN